LPHANSDPNPYVHAVANSDDDADDEL